MTEAVYKVLSAAAFVEATRKGYLTGSPDDLCDGFIHLSAVHQLEGTLGKHFAGQDGLILLAIDPGRLTSALRWEASRGGELFPHLYAPLDLAALLWAEPLPLGPNGRHILPEGACA